MLVQGSAILLRLNYVFLAQGSEYAPPYTRKLSATWFAHEACQVNIIGILRV